MADREKVMKALETCLSGDPDLCDECPYFTGRIDCSHKMETDALALLREQEPVKPEIRENYFRIRENRWFVCGKCGNGLTKVLPDGKPAINTKYCNLCGKAVKWNG